MRCVKLGKLRYLHRTSAVISGSKPNSHAFHMPINVQ